MRAIAMTMTVMIEHDFRDPLKGFALPEKERLAALPEADTAADELEAITEGRRQFRAGQSVTLRHAMDRRAQRSRTKKS